MHNFDQLFWGSLRLPQVPDVWKIIYWKIDKLIFSLVENYDRVNCDLPRYNVEF